MNGIPHPKPARWLRRVLADPRLSDADRLVARAMAAHMEPDCTLHATAAEIAEWTRELQVATS